MTRIELDNAAFREAVQAGGPIEVVDPATGQAFYLISAEQYQKVQSICAGDFDPRTGYPLIDQVMLNDDANDPLLDSYQ